MTHFKQLILPIFLCLPFLAFSQGRFGIDVRVSPDYTYRHFRYTTEFGKSYKDGYDEREKSGTGGHASINFTPNITSKFGLRIGVQLSKLSYSGTAINAFNLVGWDAQGRLTEKYIIPPVLDKQKTDYLFLNVPITSRFIFFNSKISPYIELGFVPTYQLEGTVTYSYLNDRVVLTNPYNKQLTLLAYGGLGVQFKVSESFNIFLQPTIQYQLSRNTKSLAKILSQHLYSMGTEIGIGKRF